MTSLIIDDENLDDANQIQALLAALDEEERLDNELLAEIEELDRRVK
jgi:hypothetical protein